MRNGQPVPLVRSAVRATIPVAPPHRPERRARRRSRALRGRRRPSYRDWVGGMHDEQVGDGARRARRSDAGDRPAPCAASSIAAPLECGVDPAIDRRAPGAGGVGVGRPRRGERAARRGIAPPRGRRTATASPTPSAATWAARGMMAQSDAVYRALPPATSDSRARAHDRRRSASGSADGTRARHGDGRRTRLAVRRSVSSMDAPRPRARSVDARPTAPSRRSSTCVRASEMYTSSRTSAPIPELPAVIAAIVALNLGDLDDRAHRDRRRDRGRSGRPVGEPGACCSGGRGSRCSATGPPRPARRSRRRGSRSASTPSPRDAMLAEAMQVAIARRYEDAAGLEAAWRRRARQHPAHRVDLYLLLPLAELVIAAARVGDTDACGRTSPGRSRSSSSSVARRSGRRTCTGPASSRASC